MMTTYFDEMRGAEETWLETYLLRTARVRETKATKQFAKYGVIILHDINNRILLHTARSLETELFAFLAAHQRLAQGREV